MSKAAQEQKLAKAKAGLILDQPFFASILLGLPLIEDNSQPTMCTDGDEIRFNAEFLAGMTQSETVFVLAHETLHCVFQHMHRRGNRTPNRWNQAADYVINQTLTDERIGTMPQGGLYNPQLFAQGKGTSEGIYELLPESDEQKQPGQPGGSLDQVHDAGTDNGKSQTDQAKLEQKRADMQVRIQQAKQAAKMCGKLSAGIERLVADLVKPKVDWKAQLRRFLSERSKTDLSYSKPKRRFMSEDIMLPSLIGERLGRIAVAVDCSGSVGEKELSAFSAEIRSIVEETKPTAVDVIYFDSRVCHTETFGPDDTVKLTPHGGGGTAFSPIFEHIAAQAEQPIACVVLTDLCCSDFGQCPAYPVLWASTERGEAPFGEVLYLDGVGHE